MKKLFLMMSVAFAMASCSNDDIVSGADEGNLVPVTFNVALNDAAATRAISCGSDADRLVMAVYDVDGNEVDALRQDIADAFDEDLKAEIKVTLAKGQTYSFAFWAQNPECTAYDVTDLKAIRVSYEGVACNDEVRDAFFGNVKPMVVTGNFERDVVLKRPFAQLNLAVSDINAAAAAGITPKEVKVVVSELAGELNAFTGQVGSALANVEFSLEDILYNVANEEHSGDEMLVLKNPVTINGTEYTTLPWMGMNYILVNDGTVANDETVDTAGAASTTVDVNFTLTTNQSAIELFSANTPVQRNFRTNIIAQLTSVGIFNIVIDPIYDGENNVIIDGDGGQKVESAPVRGGIDEETGEPVYYESVDQAIAAGEEEIFLPEGEYAISADPKSDVKIVGASTDTKIEYTKNVGMGEHDATFENVTVVAPGNSYTGLQHSGAVTFNDCVIENTYWCYSGEEKTVFNNCTFKATVGADGKPAYNVWTYGSNVDFNNCVFECAGKSVLIYAEGGNVLEDVNFKDCKFYASAPANDEKAAIEIDSSLEPVGNVIIENCTAEDFDLGSNSGNMLYNLKKGEMGVNCNLTVIFADGVNFVNGEYQISSAEGMYWFANEVNVNGKDFDNDTFVLTADIDLKNELWEPIGQDGRYFKGTFDGNGKTIKNLRVDMDYSKDEYASAGLFGWFELGRAVVKGLTIDGADIKGHHYVAAIIGYSYGSIENCTVKNATLSSTFGNDGADGDKCGAVVGYSAADGGKIINCVAENCQIDAVRDAGQIVGAARTTDVTGCSATDVTVENNGTAPAGYYETETENIFEEIIGRKL